MRSIWKWIGLAGVAGVVAGGVLVARDQRQRNSYTPTTSGPGCISGWPSPAGRKTSQ